MPLVYKKRLSPEGVLGVWRIEEPEAFFLDSISLHPEEAAQLQFIRGRRRVEWLAGRQLVHLLSERDIRGAVIKDEFGKPYLDQSRYHISMSHTLDMAAVIAGPRPVGIDIQAFVRRIVMLAPKFVHRDEVDSWQSASDPIEALHVIWGAKECIYKAYGRRQIDFREDLRILPFTFREHGGVLEARLLNKDRERSFTAHYYRMFHTMMVYLTETTPEDI